MDASHLTWSGSLRRTPPEELIHEAGISRFVANKRLRAVLIQGARAYIHRVKEPKSPKDRWLMAMVDRSGYGKASVALANKNVRTAWALLTRGTEYNKFEGLAV